MLRQSQPGSPALDQVDTSVQEALQDMKALMREKGGCGLAGPQVGMATAWTLERLGTRA